MLRVVMITKVAWQVNEEVNRDKTGDTDKMIPNEVVQICDFQWEDDQCTRTGDNRRLGTIWS